MPASKAAKPKPFKLAPVSRRNCTSVAVHLASCPLSQLAASILSSAPLHQHPATSPLKGRAHTNPTQGSRQPLRRAQASPQELSREAKPDTVSLRKRIRPPGLTKRPRTGRGSRRALDPCAQLAAVKKASRTSSRVFLLVATTNALLRQHQCAARRCVE